MIVSYQYEPVAKLPPFTVKMAAKPLLPRVTSTIEAISTLLGKPPKELGDWSTSGKTTTDDGAAGGKRALWTGGYPAGILSIALPSL
jgi:hypothetical protein